VLDEADEMLDMGFREDLEFILDSLPADRRTLLFSATIARDIASWPAALPARRGAHRHPRRATSSHGDIEYRAIRVAPNEVELGVVNVLRYFESPAPWSSATPARRATSARVSLRERGFAAVACRAN
jgi:ATP-dependent RNA helicase DeaD